MSTGVTDTVYNRARSLLSESSALPATLLIDSLISSCCDADASDLHLDPVEDGISVRVRIDGTLRALDPFPKTVHDELIARLKVLAGLRTDEHFAPQDGRFRYDHKRNGGRRVDVRLSIAPTYYGENAVLRFLTPTDGASTLSRLGLSDAQEVVLTNILARTHGMVLMTGPTGSGKTTTLYALMRLVAEHPVSLVTIEDPIEYSLRGAVQMQTRAGCTFADGLRSILRQDPDVIMVGEIRDTETAGLAVNAALTGHLVLSTLHTNDAPGALPRLMDLGVEPYLIASTVSLVVAQRLVRRICTGCAIEARVSQGERDRLLSVFREPVPAWVSRGRGCEACNGSGYRGRVGVYEILEFGTEMQEAVLCRASTRELRAIALTNGMVPLCNDGFGKIATGLTTVEEVLRLGYE